MGRAFGHDVGDIHPLVLPLQGGTLVQEHLDQVVEAIDGGSVQGRGPLLMHTYIYMYVCVSVYVTGGKNSPQMGNTRSEETLCENLFVALVGIRPCSQ